MTKVVVLQALSQMVEKVIQSRGGRCRDGPQVLTKEVVFHYLLFNLSIVSGSFQRPVAKVKVTFSKAQLLQ